jgi:hypothetical protein
MIDIQPIHKPQPGATLALLGKPTVGVDLIETETGKCQFSDWAQQRFPFVCKLKKSPLGIDGGLYLKTAEVLVDLYLIHFDNQDQDLQAVADILANEAKRLIQEMEWYRT